MLLAAPAAWAHGSVHERIEELDARLRERPKDAALLAERGQLHALHEDWEAAAADFEAARAIDPELSDVDHQLGNALVHIGEHARAVAVLSAALERRPTHVDARIVRARAYAAKGEHEKAAADFSRAIAQAERPAPRYYLERAKAIAARGPQHVDAAVASLREGMERLGPIVSLVEPALELESERGRYRKALELLALLPATLRATPEWRVRRAALLARAGEREQALSAYREARRALDALPEHRRRTDAALALSARIDRELAALEPPAAEPPARPGWLLPAAVSILGAVALLLIVLLRRLRRRAQPST